MLCYEFLIDDSFLGLLQIKCKTTNCVSCAPNSTKHYSFFPFDVPCYRLGSIMYLRVSIHLPQFLLAFPQNTIYQEGTHCIYVLWFTLCSLFHMINYTCLRVISCEVVNFDRVRRCSRSRLVGNSSNSLICQNIIIENQRNSLKSNVKAIARRLIVYFFRCSIQKIQSPS